MPFGAAILAAVATGTGLIGKYRPTVKAMAEVVRNVERLPDATKEDYKIHMALITTAATKGVIAAVKRKS